MSHQTGLRLAVIIVSYNVRELLAACLDSVYAGMALCPELSTEVWVVDNASSDGSATMVREQFPQAHIIASGENLGFAGGNNVALLASGFSSDSAPSTTHQHPPFSDDDSPNDLPTAPDFALLLNPDTEVLDDAIGQMVGFLAQNPDIGGVGTQLVYSDGRFQHGAFAFPGLLQLWFDLFPPRPRRLLESRLNGRYPRQWYDQDTPFPVGFALGAALMVRRETVQAVGLLDDGYFMYAEEVDWCWRMHRAGWPLYCVPTARVVHHVGASASQFRERSRLDLWRSRRRLFGRFYNPVRRWLAFRIVLLGMWAAQVRARRTAARCEISETELQARLTTYEAISNLYRS